MNVDKFVLPNKVKYLDFVHNTYHPDIIQSITDDPSINKRNQRHHQMLINRYMDITTPYRGLLLYHELGTGKTATAIGVLNKYLNTRRNIFVMLPASLRNNFIKELLIHSPFRRYKGNVKWSCISNTDETALRKSGYPYFSKTKDGSYWVPEYSKNIAGVKTIVSGETYNKIDEDSKMYVDKVIVGMINDRITFVHYNGLNASLLEKYKGKLNKEKLVRWFKEEATWYQLDAIANVKKYYGYTPKRVSKKIWIPQYKHDIPDGNVVGKSKYVDLEKGSKEHVDATIDIIMADGREYVRLLNDKDLKVFDYAFNNSLVIIDEVHKFIRMVINESDIATQLYNYLMDAENAKMMLLSGTPVINKPYEVSGLLNLVRGRIPTYSVSGKINNEDAYMKYVDTIDTFKGSSNIVLLPRDYVREGSYIKNERWKETPYEIVKKLNGNGKITLKNNYALPTTNSDFDKMFINVKKVSGKNVETFVNHDLFMRRIMGLVSFFDRYGTNYPHLHETVYKNMAMSDHQFNIYMEWKTKESEMEKKNRMKRDTDDDKGVFKAFTRLMCNFVFPPKMVRPFPNTIAYSDLVENDVKSVYGKKLTKLVNDFKGMNLSDDELRIYSPKYMEIIKDINETDGKVLVYSQFRTVEGVGMFKIYLEKCGFVDAKVDPDVDNGGNRFMILDLDKDKANRQIKTFNNKTNNLYGENVKILIITGSGSEGISLRHTRLVCILEPYWNVNLMKQVIGRAVRDGSHNDLEPEKRDVRAYVYLASATDYQAKNNITFRLQSDNMTTDQEVMNLALEKDSIVQDMLRYMKSAAFDCSIHAKTNRLKHGCYQWSVNLDRDLDAYKPDINDEKTHMEHKVYEKSKMVKGIVRKVDNVKYVEYEDRLYDYNAYMYSKKLIPIEITVDQDNKKDSKSSTTKYSIKDVEGDGSCFYRALYVSLKHLGGSKLSEYLKCVGISSAKDELDFVKKMRGKIVESMKSSDYLETMYNHLKTLDEGDYKEVVEAFDEDLYNDLEEIPKTFKKFRDIVIKHTKMITCYASELDISLVKDMCTDVINITIINNSVKSTQTFNKNNVYLLNIGEMHYNAILPEL